MTRICAVCSCKNRVQKGNGISFHRFPFSKPALVQHWLVNIRRQGWTPSKYSLVCSDHFDDDCYIGGPHRRRMLKQDAVPTKFNFTNASHSEEVPKSVNELHKLPMKEVFQVQLIESENGSEGSSSSILELCKQLDNEIFPIVKVESETHPEEYSNNIANLPKLLKDGELPVLEIESSESHSEDSSSSISKSFEPLENGKFPVFEISSSEGHSEESSSSISESFMPLNNGIFLKQEIISENHSEESASSICDSFKPLNIGTFPKQEIISVDNSEESSSNISDSLRSLNNGVFPKDKIISENHSEESSRSTFDSVKLLCDGSFPKQEVVPEEYSEASPSCISDSMKPVCNGIIPKQEVVSEDHLEESNLSDLLKPPQNGIIPKQEIVSEDHVEEGSLSNLPKPLQNGISLKQEESNSEGNPSVIDDSPMSTENSSFQAQEIEFLLSEDGNSESSFSGEQEFSDSNYSSHSLHDSQIQDEPLQPDSKLWTASWSDAMFIDDCMNNEEKLPLTTTTKKTSSVKTIKVVYYGERLNQRIKAIVKSEPSDDQDLSSLGAKQKQNDPCRNSVFQTDAAISNADNFIKIENGNSEPDEMFSEAIIDSNGDHKQSDHMHCSDDVTVLNNATALDLSFQRIGPVTHQSDITEAYNSNRTVEKQTNAERYSSNSIVVNGHSHNISPNEMKRHYDAIIAKKDKQLSLLRKRLKTCKKRLAQKDKTIATLNAALVDLDFMNPYS